MRVNATGTPWLATAGSGDVLSGLAGSLLAAGLTAVDAGSCAAYLHGLARPAHGPRRAGVGPERGRRDSAGVAGREPGGLTAREAGVTAVRAGASERLGAR
ncbi:hypothetical protein GCM10020256_29590 [Streptomyces thermocoprophilus]